MKRDKHEEAQNLQETKLTCTSGRVYSRVGRGGKKFWFLRLNFVEQTGSEKRYKTRDVPTGLSATRRNKAQAEAMLEPEIAKYQEGAGMLLVRYCREWLERKKDMLEQPTCYGYEYRISFLDAYFEPKGITIAEIRPKDVEDFYGWLIRYRKKNGREGDEHLVNSTMRAIAKTLKIILDDAVLRGYIRHNPCDGIQMPSRPEHVKTKPYVDEDSIRIFLNAIKGTKAELPFKLTLYGGLRREELAGLKWTSLRDGVCHIENTVTGTGKVVEKNRAKNRSSVRSFALPPDLVELFKAEKESQDESRKILGNMYENSGYVFVKNDGKPYRPDYFTKLFKEVIRNTPELDQNLHLHSLRNSCVTIMLNRGASVRKVAEWVGHSDTHTTQNIYATTNQRQQNKLAAEWGNYLFGEEE